VLDAGLVEMLVVARCRVLEGIRDLDFTHLAFNMFLASILVANPKNNATIMENAMVLVGRMFRGPSLKERGGSTGIKKLEPKLLIGLNWGCWSTVALRHRGPVVRRLIDQFFYPVHEHFLRKTSVVLRPLSLWNLSSRHLLLFQQSWCRKTS